VRVVAIRDVTERKKWEQEILRAKEEAEEMAQLKSSLLNNMSHELRTPITSIIGYAELILNEPDTDHEDFALRIQESGQRLSRTLRAVLEMAQVESGTLEVTRTDVDVRLLVRKVVDRHRSTAEQKDLTLQTQVRAPDGSFYTDLTLVRRILDNLVHNALKFTEEGQVEVEVETDAGGMRLAVSDTGIGIAPDFREQLFDPFTQESAGRSRTHEGTGLGLALADRMVALLGGDVEVESVKGEGTTVVVWIPLSGDTEESRAGVESKPA
jgi:signal transduction histidine kinase